METTMIDCRKSDAVIMEQCGLIYEYTHERDYLNQYYQLREDCYKSGWGLSIFSGAEDEHDRSGHIMVVRQGDRVVGGGRVVFRYSHSPAKLPMETDDFLLHEVLPELGSDETIIGEIGRIAVLPEYRGKRLGKIGVYLLAKAQQYGCRYLTTVAPVRQTRKYRKIADMLGIDILILSHVPVADQPYYNQIEMKLLLCDLETVPDCRFLLKK